MSMEVQVSSLPDLNIRQAKGIDKSTLVSVAFNKLVKIDEGESSVVCASPIRGAHYNQGGNQH